MSNVMAAAQMYAASIQVAEPATSLTGVSAPSPAQTRETVMWVFAFLVVWMLWAANQLADLDRSGEMLQNMDTSELLKFVYSTLDLPSYLFGVLWAIYRHLTKPKGG
ncbi:hypothetical protein E0H75_07135 [Kribbella capetownensis]|uniref:Uncharacterized protein n=2 Tax=Kribbella capetownensis TaxID=1572659 RepID=A0A4R0K2Z5_9ACTN|nr:hypothetical protein [Kribbella capetownensis]TCC53457.1 hypothetical protein E0H75_07135 [Kribbella capetownensis]